MKPKITLDDIAGLYLSPEIIEAIEHTDLKPSEIERLINSQPKFSVAIINGELDFRMNLRVPLKPSWRVVFTAIGAVVVALTIFM